MEPVRARRPVPDWMRAPVPAMGLATVVVFARLKRSVALLVMAPGRAPVLPPAPIWRVPLPSLMRVMLQAMGPL